MASTKQVKYRYRPEKPTLLIGFMGSGKTTVGPLLARVLGRPFLDLDAEILRLGRARTIAQIFAVKGEKGFRRLESRALGRVLASRAAPVVAAGGGLVKLASNRRRLRASGAQVVWLDVSWTALWRRLSREDHRKRPLLARGGGRRRSQADVRRVWNSRRPLYAAAATVRVRVPAGEAAARTTARVLRLFGTEKAK